MTKTEILQIILKEKLVSIVRLKQQSEVAQVLQALVKGGIKVLEITANTPGFLEEISVARTLYPNVLIGVGTATTPKITQDAINAGAQFIVTPNTNAEIVKVAHAANIPVLMGALTPTEISTAFEAGADIIKLFPSENLGIGYFKSVSGPFSEVPFFAVGGIDINNAKEWLNAGVLGLGLGSSLTKPISSDEDFTATVERAKSFIKLIK